MDHISESATVTCRVCRIRLSRKYYKAHLKNIHPKENPNDLSGLSQPKITSLLTSSHSRRSTVVPQLGDDGQEDADIGPGVAPAEAEEDSSVVEQGHQVIGEVPDVSVDINKDSLKRNNSDDHLPRKKRFKSGDSAFGDGDDDLLGDLSVKAADEEIESSKFDIIIKELENMKNDLKDLKKEKRQAAAAIVSESDEPDEDLRNKMMVLQFSRSIEEIEGLGFKFDDENHKVKCVVCDILPPGEKPSSTGEFGYNPSSGLAFNETEKLSRNFINLKANVKSHILKSKIHCSNLEKERKKVDADCELASKNRKAGLNLGRAAVKNYLLGRPFTDYEKDVLIMKKSGGIVGEINHSAQFPAKFRKCVSRVVNARVCRFIKTPLKQTGHLPPVSLSADKGTYKGLPRQFCGIVTINPGGENFLEILSAGQPIVSEGSSGLQLAVNMKAAFDSIGVSGEQIKSGVFDGVYDHVHIGRHLGELYPDMKVGEFLFTWDPLHRTGIADKNTCKKLDHKWIVKFNNTCHQLYLTFNWGASHVKLREAAVGSGIRPRNLVNFSETRFANSKRRVYQIILDQFPAIMACLEQYILEGERNRSGL